MEGFRSGLVVVEGPLVWLNGGGESELGAASGRCASAGEGEAALFGLHCRRAAESRVGAIVVVVEERVQDLWR